MLKTRDYWCTKHTCLTEVLTAATPTVTCACFRPSQGTEQTENNSTIHVRMKDLIDDSSKHDNCRVVYHSAHSGWVRQG